MNLSLGLLKRGFSDHPAEYDDDRQTATQAPTQAPAPFVQQRKLAMSAVCLRAMLTLLTASFEANFADFANFDSPSNPEPGIIGNPSVVQHGRLWLFHSGCCFQARTAIATC